MKIIAHRGASGKFLENTEQAFQAALQSGAHGIETDVQLTKDNFPVLFHDETIDRLTTAKGFVKDYTWEELKGIAFKGKQSQATIMSLDAFLQLVADKPIEIHLECKNNRVPYPGLEEIILAKLKEYGCTDKTIISSFRKGTIDNLKDQEALKGRGLLRSRHYKTLFQTAEAVHATSIHINFRLLRPGIVRTAHERGLKVYVYTVNSPLSMMVCKQMNCDGIFTDRPYLASNIKL